MKNLFSVFLKFFSRFVKRDDIDQKIEKLLTPDENVTLRRPEKVGRPANRPKIDIDELLKKEAEHIRRREEL